MIIRIIILVVTGLFIGQIPLFSGFEWVSLFALIPVFWVLNTPDKKARFLYAFLFGLTSKMSTFSFIFVSKMQYNNYQQIGQNTFMFLLYVFIISIPWIAVWYCFYSLRKKYYIYWVVLFPLLIVFTEYILSYVDLFPHFYGFYLYKFNILYNLIAYTGIYGATFFSLFVNSFLAELLLSYLEKTKFSYKMFFSSLAFVLLVFIAGNYRGNKIEKEILQSKTISLFQIQDNISYKDLNEFNRNNEKRLKDFRFWVENTIRKADKNTDLIVWPENVVPYWYNNGQSERILKNISFHLHTNIISGVGIFVDPNDKQKKRYNAAFYYDSKGEKKAVYKKQKLVPFNEYLPFKNKLDFLYKRLKNKTPNLESSHKADLIETELGKVGIAICYESIFSKIIKKYTKADLILNLSNDIWLQNSNGMKLHMIATGTKAAEFGIPVYISSYSGISALFLPNGKILYETLPMTKVTRNVKIYLYKTNTFYGKFNDWFPWFCIVIFLIFLNLFGFQKFSLSKNLN